MNLPLWLCTATLLTLPAAAQAELYRCTQNGKPLLTDRPCAALGLSERAVPRPLGGVTARPADGEAMTREEPPAPAAEAAPVRPSPESRSAPQDARSARRDAPGSRRCEFPGLNLPAEFQVFAGGAYGGRPTVLQIDQSGHEATQMDVTVNNPGAPVILMLGAYEPAIWNVRWSKGTRIIGVLATGYHRQVIAGLPKSTPTLISTYDNRGACGYSYVSGKNLDGLNPKSRMLFGRPVDMVYPAVSGVITIGPPVASSSLVSSPDTPLESVVDRNAPLAGEAGLTDAVRKGVIRKATAADARAWAEAVARSQPRRDIPPVAGQGIPKPSEPYFHNGYVVLKAFTFPAGLYGAHSATFFIPAGVPAPGGNRGHSDVYDFNTLKCQGSACGAR